MAVSFIFIENEGKQMIEIRATRMLIHGPCPALFNRTSIYPGGFNFNSFKRSGTTSTTIKNTASLTKASSCSLALTSLLAAATVLVSAANAVEMPQEAETLSNIPQTLSGECAIPQDCKKARIQRPKSRKAESCTIKCVTTCIRGGEGSPGEGPLNIRRPLVVFKPGFRSRQYCLVECSDICNLIGDEDDGP